MNSNPSKPTPAHPWRSYQRPSIERARAVSEQARDLRLAFCAEQASATTLQGWHVTHLLIFEGESMGRMYRHRGMYYTLEQWTHGEPGLRKSDLREGERFAKV